MLKLVRFVVQLGVLALAAIGSSQYKFQRIDSATTGSFHGVHIAAGKVAYRKTGDVYRWSGGVPRRVAGPGDVTPYGVLTTTIVCGVSAQSTLFHGRWSSSARSSGMFLETDGAVVPVAAPGMQLPIGPVYSSDNYCAIDASNRLAITARFGDSSSNFYAVVYDGVEVSRSVQHSYAGLRCKDGYLAFHSTQSNPTGVAIFHWSGESLNRCVGTGDPAPGGYQFYNQTMGRDVHQGEVLFGGTWRLPNFTFMDGVFLWSGGTYNPIAVLGELGPFGVWTGIGEYSDMALTPTGAYFFAGSLRGNGIYRWTGSQLSCVFAIGDPMLGSTLTDFATSSGGFNAAREWTVDSDGTVAFGYTLANGQRGVALARPLFPIGRT